MPRISRVPLQAFALVGLLGSTASAQTTTIISDTFTGTDGTSLAAHAPEVTAVGAGWQVSGTGGAPGSPTLQSGQASSANNATATWVEATIETAAANVTVGADYQIVSGGWAGVVTRFTDSDNFIAGWAYDTGLYLYRRQAGAWAQLAYSAAGGSNVVGTTHRIEFRTAGATIELWWDGIRQLQVTDTFQQNATRHGVIWVPSLCPTCRLDNFRVESPALASVTHVTVTPASASVSLGRALALAAHLYDASNNEVVEGATTWTTSNAAAVSIAPGGGHTAQVTARAVGGAATITATAPNGASATVPIAVDLTQTVVYDTFTGTNGTALTSHAPDYALGGALWQLSGTAGSAGTPALQGGRAAPGTNATATWVESTIEAGAANVNVGAEYQIVGGGWAGVVTRFTDSENFIAGWAYDTGLYLYRRQAGAWTQLAYAPTGGSNVVGTTHRIEFRSTGATVELWWDGVRQLQVTDTLQQTATRHGLIWVPSLCPTCAFDNFIIENPSLAVISRLTVTPGTDAVVPLPQQLAVTARAYNTADIEILGGTVTWTSSNPSIASIVATGSRSATIVSHASGTVQVTATGPNGVSSAIAVTVNSDRLLLWDTFTGADSTLLVNHAPDVAPLGGQWVVAGNPAAVLKGHRVGAAAQDTVYGDMFATIYTGVADGIIGADLNTAASGTLSGYPIGGVIFRFQNADNFMAACVGCASYGLSVWQVSDDAWTLVATSGIGGASVAGAVHRLEVRLNGSAIEVWWDGMRSIQANNASGLTATSHGLLWSTVWDWLSTFDNFTVEAAPTPPPASVVVTPVTTTVMPGSAQTFTAQAFDAANALIPGTLFHWTVSNPAAVSLMPSAYFAPVATVRGIAANVTVIATPLVGPTGSAAVTVDAGETRVFDRFIGADETPLENHVPDIPGVSAWMPLGPVTAWLSGNEVSARDQSTSSDDLAYAIDSGVSDGTIAVDFNAAIGPLSGYPMGGVVFRVQDNQNFWAAGFGLWSFQLSLWKVVNGQWQLVASDGTLASVGHQQRLAVVLDGPSIHVLVNDVPHLSATDSFAVAATRHGLKWSPVWDWRSTLDNFTVSGHLPCVTGIASTTVPGAAGGTGTIAVSAPPSCTWDGVSIGTWLTLTSSSGTGNGTITYEAPANQTWVPRSTTVYVGATAASVVQQSLPRPTDSLCAPLISPPSAAYGSGGGAAEFSVLVPAGCSYAVVAWSDWLVPSVEVGTGNGTIHYGVDANATGVARSGTITVADQNYGVLRTFGVDQSAQVAAGGGGGGSWPSTLTANQVLSTLQSPNGLFQFTYQSGGNIVLSQGSTVLWSSGTSGPGYAVMQGDGNFVIYAPDDSVIWHTHTSAHPAASLTVQNDGTAIIVDSTGSVLWSTQGGSSGSGDGGGAMGIVVALPVVTTPGLAGGGAIALLAPSGRAWTVTSTANWLSTWDATGTGSQAVWYRVTDNPGSARSGSLTFYDGVTTQTVTVNQQASDCGDSCDDPAPPDCYPGGDGSDPGGGGSGGDACPIAPYCDAFPTDPYCQPDWCKTRGQPKFSGRQFGTDVMCVEPPPPPPDVPYLRNFSNQNVVYKFEDCELGLGVVPPGGVVWAPIDGVKPPAYNTGMFTDWYKVIDFFGQGGTKVEILADGTPKKVGGFGQFVRDLPPGGCADDSITCKHEGGRRFEPLWSNLHNDWLAIPNRPIGFRCK